MADDPYGHASATQLSLFRRPLPTTNLRFLSTINWDGRNEAGSTVTSGVYFYRLTAGKFSASRKMLLLK